MLREGFSEEETFELRALRPESINPHGVGGKKHFRPKENKSIKKRERKKQLVERL